MPLKRKEGESKDEFISRCIGYEIKNGYPQDQAAAICYTKAEEYFSATASYDAPPANIDFKIGDKVSFDYDDTLSTARGKEWAKREISNGSTVYIISARSSKEGMLSVAQDLGIPESRVYATGTNQAKIQKVKELGIDKHYDNNRDVIRQLGSIGKLFNRSVLFRADQTPDEKYLDGSFSIYFKSDSTLYNSKDIAHQKAKEYGFPNNVVYSHFEADIDFTSDDPLMAKLLQIGRPKDESKYIKSGEIKEPINFSKLDEFEKEFTKNVDLKFVRIETVFTYEKRPDAADLKTTSRPFCKGILAANKEWKLSEIRDLVNDPDFRSLYDLSKYPQFADPVQFTGGWYRNPETGVTTPWCRHAWVPKTKIIR